MVNLSFFTFTFLNFDRRRNELQKHFSIDHVTAEDIDGSAVAISVHSANS